MRTSAVLLLLSLAGCLAVGLAQDAGECPDITACARDVSELRGQVKTQGAEINKLEAQLAQLKADLAAAESKRTAAEDKLSAAQADAKSAKSELSKLEQKLSSTSTSLETAQSKLTRAERDLHAAKTKAEEAAGAGSSCKLSLKRAESQISEQASRLEELKAVEEALLPVWLSRRLVQAQSFTAEQSQQLWTAMQESDIAAKATEAVAPYVDAATAAVGPYWDQAMEVSKPARETGAVYFQKAKAAYDKLPIAETVAAAKQQTAVIERELKQTLGAFIATQPSLSALGDPVLLQLVVYTVLGLPLLLLLVVLTTLLGGPRKGQSAPAQAKAAKRNSGSGGHKPQPVQQQQRKGSKTIRA